MDFPQKLNYLFDLTHAEGKELAAAMNVTAPQISKMRRGVRGLPKSREAAEVLARFFARRCGSDFQRDALAKTIHLAQLRTVDSEAALAGILLDWLSGERDADGSAARRADGFLQRFGTLPAETDRNDPDGGARRVLSSGGSSFLAYYGNEGRRLAVQTFLRYLIQRGEAYTINILTDESVAWITEEADYSRQMQSSMLRLTEQGCVFRRVAGPISDMDQAFESLNRWFPMYMAGKAASYYYKRMRDNLNHLTLLVVPNVAVVFSFSVGSVPQKNGVTFFTTDEKTVNSMAVEFENYYALCEPILKVYSTEDSPRRLHDCMLEYEGCKGDCYQRSNALSFITLPWDEATALHTGGEAEIKKLFLTSFAQRHKLFMANLEQHDFTDMIRLAAIDEIMDGRVCIPGAFVISGEAQYYTPTAYLHHLRSILYLLEHRAHYHVVLRDAGDADDVILYVKEGYTAILMRERSPFSVLEVSERYLVDAFAELLRRMVPADLTAAAKRRGVIAAIKAHIAELERQLGER